MESLANKGRWKKKIGSEAACLQLEVLYALSPSILTMKYHHLEGQKGLRKQRLRKQQKQLPVVTISHILHLVCLVL